MGAGARWIEDDVVQRGAGSATRRSVISIAFVRDRRRLQDAGKSFAHVSRGGRGLGRGGLGRRGSDGSGCEEGGAGECRDCRQRDPAKFGRASRIHHVFVLPIAVRAPCRSLRNRWSEPLVGSEVSAAKTPTTTAGVRIDPPERCEDTRPDATGFQDPAGRSRDDYTAYRATGPVELRSRSSGSIISRRGHRFPSTAARTIPTAASTSRSVSQLKLVNGGVSSADTGWSS